LSRLESIIQLLKQNPEDVFLHYAEAMEYISIHDIDKAINKLESIRSSFPSYLPLYYQLAKLYEQSESTDNAIKIYEMGIELAIQNKEKKTELELRSALEELTF